MIMRVDLEKINGRYQGACFPFRSGFECGIVLANFQDVHEGDVLETYETRKVERELSS